MSPKDVAGVFSRLFIVGHFLPAFFAVGAALLASTDEALPHGLAGKSFGIQLLVVGAAALPLGLLLSSMHAHFVRMFSGEATERQRIEDKLSAGGNYTWSSRSGWQWAIPRKVGEITRHIKACLARRQIRKIAVQRRKRSAWTSKVASRAPWQEGFARLDEEFPDKSDKVLPTRLGNAIRAHQSYAESRYGLNGAAVWPRIEMLLSTEERSLIADARAEVAFFINCAVCSIPLAVYVAIDTIIDRGENLWIVAWLAGVVVIPVAAFMFFRLLAVTATFRSGAPIRAAIDLHRLDLYDRLGVRRPVDHDDERIVADAINALLLQRIPLPPEVRAPTPPRATA
jgi:hypothetical protein